MCPSLSVYDSNLSISNIQHSHPLPVYKLPLKVFCAHLNVPKEIQLSGDSQTSHQQLQAYKLQIHSAPQEKPPHLL